MRWKITARRSCFTLLLLCFCSLPSAFGQGSTPTRFNLDGFNDLRQISTPSTNPNSGRLRIYAKTASTVCIKNNLGTEVCFAAAGITGSGTIDTVPMFTTATALGDSPCSFIAGVLTCTGGASFGGTGASYFTPQADPTGGDLVAGAFWFNNTAPTAVRFTYYDGSAKQTPLTSPASLYGSSPAALVVTKAAGADPTTNHLMKWGAGGAAIDGGVDVSVAQVQFVLGATTAVAFPNSAVTYCAKNIINFSWVDCTTNPFQYPFPNEISGTIATASFEWQAVTLAAANATTTLTLSVYDVTAAAELFNSGAFIPKPNNCTIELAQLCHISVSPGVTITRGHPLDIKVTVSGAWDGTGTPIPTANALAITMKITGSN